MQAQTHKEPDLERYISYITSFIPEPQKSDVVFYHNGSIAIGKVNAYLGGSDINTKQYYHIVVLDNDPPHLSEGAKRMYFHKHHAVMLPPEHEYRIGGMFSACGYYYYLIVSRDVIEQIAREYYDRAVSLNVVQSTVSLQAVNLLNQIELELAGKKPGAGAMSRYLLSVFIAHIFRGARADDRAETLIDTGGITKACDYIERYYNSQIDIDELAHIATISKYHFMRQFKQATGLTPYSYIKQLRLQKGRALLIETNLTVSEIAKMCGFVSSSHFASNFRKRFHTTPSCLRKDSKQHFQNSISAV